MGLPKTIPLLHGHLRNIADPLTSTMLSMYRGLWLAYARLLRLPNVFTAWADIALGLLISLALASPPPAANGLVWLALFLSSSSLYLSGMVWNDIFDRHEDARWRPFRPLPSRHITLSRAVGLGSGLLLVGIASGWAAAWALGTAHQPDWDNPGLVASILAVVIMLYDGVWKATALGPWLMGSCRFGNVLLGLSAISPELLPIAWRLHVAAVVGIYITGVTWLARREEEHSQRRELLFAALLIACAMILALWLRARLPETMGTFLFPFLWVGFGFYLGEGLEQALRQPSPRNVQAAVVRCLRGLVLLDALIATAFVGLPGVLLILLLLPVRWLSQWIYMT